MLELKLNYFGYIMRRHRSIQKCYMLGKNKGKRNGKQVKWNGDIKEAIN